MPAAGARIPELPPDLEGNHLTAGRDLYITFLLQAGEMTGIDFSEAVRHLQESISFIPEVAGAIQQGDLVKAALCFERVAEAETKTYMALTKMVGIVVKETLDGDQWH